MQCTRLNLPVSMPSCFSLCLFLECFKLNRAITGLTRNEKYFLDANFASDLNWSSVVASSVRVCSKDFMDLKPDKCLTTKKWQTLPVLPFTKISILSRCGRNHQTMKFICVASKSYTVQVNSSLKDPIFKPNRIRTVLVLEWVRCLQWQSVYPLPL